MPLFLSVLSSSLINSPKLVVVDYLRLFAVVVGYSMAIRRLFSRGAGRPEAWERGPGPISLIEVEIMRSVERQPLLYNTLPQLSPDLQVPAGKVAERVRGLLEKGLLGMRTNEHKQSELFVTGVGWSAINKALQHSDD